MADFMAARLFSKKRYPMMARRIKTEER